MPTTITQKQFDKKLAAHQHWLNKDCVGWEKLRLDLSHMDCSRLNMAWVDMRGAIMEGTILKDVYLMSSDLRRANLSNAIITSASMGHANLRSANMTNTNICCARLDGADMRGAILKGADMSYTLMRAVTLNGADMRNADLRLSDMRNSVLKGANLEGADIRDADIRGANFSSAKNMPFVPMACPEKGAFIGFKRCGDFIVEIEVLSDAKRSSATTLNCRCDKARVISITNLDGSDSGKTAIESDYDSKFVYKIGETVTVNDFDNNRWNEITTGIHFFINRYNAVTRWYGKM